MESAKNKIEVVVKEYKKLFFDEYTEVVRLNKIDRERSSTDWGEIRGSDIINRAMFSISENLNSAIKQILTTEEKKWWASEHSKAGARWFVSRFPEFSLTKSK